MTEALAMFTTTFVILAILSGAVILFIWCFALAMQAKSNLTRVASLFGFIVGLSLAITIMAMIPT